MRILLVSAVLSLVAASGVAAQEFVVVVNAGADATLTRSQVADIFMKRKSGWSPVDQAKDAPVRRAFSERVMGRDVSAVEAYWQQQIFAGRDVPPDTKASDAAVLAFVRSDPRGIGYVEKGTPLGDGVKAVPLD